MKLQWIAALALLSLSFTSSIHAADARFCDHYAKTAIKQQVNNVKAGCGHSGLRCFTKQWIIKRHPYKSCWLLWVSMLMSFESFTGKRVALIA